MEQVTKALWLRVSDDLPWEYTELQLCRVYGCLPSELEDESWNVIQTHIAILNAEASVRR